MEASVLHEKDQAGSRSFPEMKDDLTLFNAIILKKVSASILDVSQLDENLQRLDRCSRLVKTWLQHEPTEDGPLIAQKEEIRKLTSIAMTTIGNLLSVPCDDHIIGEYQEYLMKCSSIIRLWMTDEIEATSSNAATQAEFQKSLARKA